MIYKVRFVIGEWETNSAQNNISFAETGYAEAPL